MFTEKHQPENIRPKELDSYLERGWYRMGQTIFTTHFLFYDDNLYSAIWTRLPLKGYGFRKSLQKLLSKNGKKFHTLVRPGHLNEEKESLYQAYRANFPRFRSPTLADYLLDKNGNNIFRTLETTVFYENRLIAFSFFDIGHSSMASIIGVYDPEFAKFSLGFYTMLLEIQYGLDQGFEFYYPGYIVPGRPKFEYKRRIGNPEEMEYYDLKRGNWYALSMLKEKEIPVSEICGQLSKVHSVLLEKGIKSELLYYPASLGDMAANDKKLQLVSPIFLNCFPGRFISPRYVVFYDMWKKSFSFCSTMRCEDLAFYLGKPIEFDIEKFKPFLNCIFKKEVLLESKKPADIVAKALEIKADLDYLFRNIEGQDFL